LTGYLLFEIAVIAICLAAGGLLKGATGAGAPVLAVPAMAAFFDVRFAIIVMLVPNLVTNAMQAWRFRRHLPEAGLMVPLLAGGVTGIVVGTYALRALDTDTLSLFVAGSVFGYVALRMARPDWVLAMAAARRLALPAGTLAGLLQGATGISAPVSITFLNAIRLGREGFIAAISTFFVTFTTVQAVAIWWNELIRPGEIWIGLAALMPVTLAMPAGAWLGRRMAPTTLDRLILVILSVLAAKLVVDALLR
jgi:uncharacterized membrane protein YfcA